MKRISVRRRGPRSYEVGPAGHGPTVMVGAAGKREALRQGKARLREAGRLEEAAALSYRGIPTT